MEVVKYNKHIEVIERMTIGAHSASQIATALGYRGAERKDFLDILLNSTTQIGQVYYEALREAQRDVYVTLQEIALSASKESVKASKLITELNHSDKVNALKEKLFGI